MKIIPGAARLNNSLKNLFNEAKTTSGHQRCPEKYYRSVYLLKDLFDGIVAVAQIERISKKNATELLLEAGFSNFIGKKIAKYIEAQQISRGNNQPLPRTRFNTGN